MGTKPCKHIRYTFTTKNSQITPRGGGIYWRPPSKLSPRQIVSIPIGGDSPGVNMTAAYFWLFLERSQCWHRMRSSPGFYEIQRHNIMNYHPDSGCQAHHGSSIPQKVGFSECLHATECVTRGYIISWYPGVQVGTHQQSDGGITTISSNGVHVQCTFILNENRDSGGYGKF